MTDALDQRKADIRARMRRLLASIDETQRAEISARACAHLVGLAEFRRATMIMLYMALPGEIDLAPAAAACLGAGKTLCVPRVDWKAGLIEAIQVTSIDDHAMLRDERGLSIPRSGTLVAPELLDLVAVPGLAFDPGGSRLGRGGGFYDRFLNRLRTRTTRVGIAFDGQIIDRVPIEGHDLSVDIVVTERRIAYAGCRRAGAVPLGGFDAGRSG